MGNMLAGMEGPDKQRVYLELAKCYAPMIHAAESQGFVY